MSSFRLLPRCAAHCVCFLRKKERQNMSLLNAHVFFLSHSHEKLHYGQTLAWRSSGADVSTGINFFCFFRKVSLFVSLSKHLHADKYTITGFFNVTCLPTRNESSVKRTASNLGLSSPPLGSSPPPCSALLSSALTVVLTEMLACWCCPWCYHFCSHSGRPLLSHG